MKMPSGILLWAEVSSSEGLQFNDIIGDITDDINRYAVPVTMTPERLIFFSHSIKHQTNFSPKNMTDLHLPEHCSALGDNKKFCFSCHPDVPCFNECCHQLDLILTPYDVLRLKTRLKRHSGIFLEQFVIIEWEEGMLFPACYLTMVDDGKASCVFVKDYGCRIYEDRPAACRAYPVGRGVSSQEDGSITEQLVLLREPHCRGFETDKKFSSVEYFKDQGLEEYNRYNDKMLQLLHHPKIQAGFRPTKEQADQYIMALYNLDTFRQELTNGYIQMNTPLSVMEQLAMQNDDKVLLLIATRWLIQEYFGE